MTCCNRRGYCDCCTVRRELCVRQGNHLRVIVDVVDQDGEPMSVQDAREIRWGVGKHLGQPAVLLKELTASSVNLGGPNVFFFDLTDADTWALDPGKYHHEAEVVTFQGRVFTVMAGALVIERRLIFD